jgi:hypothetical protein
MATVPYGEDEDLPMPPRIPGPVPFDRAVAGPAGEAVVVMDGPEDTARTRNTVEGSSYTSLGVNDPPVVSPPMETVAMPAGAAPTPGTPPMPMPVDPELMSFAVPDGGPPPSNDIEAKLMEGMFNGVEPPPTIPDDEELGMVGAGGMPPLPMPPRRRM